MNGRKFSLVYESSIEILTEINSSFDKGVLRVAYTGKNRNKSFISKSTFEKCINTIYNCPIVCNYNREADSIGAHDVEIVNTGKGLKIINVTQPVGVIPESAKYWWETIEEDNGEIHEYLCVEAIIWKRQEAYTKIKENRITDESMEITVKSGRTIDGYYHIDSFEFTAFCLLESAEPCYESACLEMFSLNESFSQMMADFKKHFSTVSPSIEGDIYSQNLLKGGSVSLDKMELLATYGLTIESLDFNIDDFSIEELKQKFEEIKNKPTDDDEIVNTNNPEETPVNPDAGTGNNEETFSLSGEQFKEQLIESLSAVKYTDPCWGEMRRYCYVDFDPDLSTVYCYDCEDWKLYGFEYSMNGDNVVINFDSKKRKKYSIVDFDEGSADFNLKYTLDSYMEVILASKDAEFNRFKKESEEKYSEATKTINEMQLEIEGLRAYQKSKIDAERKDAEDEIFERFSELNGIEAFENLRSECTELSLEDIESKCFEIKGRNAPLAFSVNKPKSQRIPIEKNRFEDEPYGGLFIQFPPSNN